MPLEDLTRSQKAQAISDFQNHEAFCRESLHIKNEIGSLVPMECRPSQIKLHAAVEKQRLKGKPVRLVVLKTRRSNFTAGSCAEIFHNVPFFAGRKALIIADKYNPAGMEALGYLQEFQNSYTPFTRFGLPIELPALARDVYPEEGEVKETIAGEKLAWENKSFVQVLSAEGGEVGRGGGRHFVLGDEVAFWRNARQTLGGVLNMVPYLKETTVILQSTANGIGGDFYELCQQAMDPNNASGWSFLFFGWLEHPLYVLPVEDPAAFMASIGKDPRYGGQEEHTLYRLHNASVQQLAWRRKTIETECLGHIALFHQEYPTTPEEAFLTSGRPALDHMALARMPISNGALGELQELDEFPKKKIVFIEGDRGALEVWRMPQEGRFYVAGADPSRGVDVSGTNRGENPDYSVLFIADADTGEQVAMLRGRIRPGAFADYIAIVGRWYNWAYLVPESNDAGFIDALIRTRYPMERIYTQGREPGDLRPVTSQDVGFYTDTLTRSWLVGAGAESIRNHSVKIHSRVTVQECYTMEIKPNGIVDHRRNCHSDCFIALCLEEIGRRRIPSRKKTIDERAGKPMVMRYGQAKRKSDDDE